MYDNGTGTPVDDEKAVYWYTKSAEQGHAKAQYNLGIMYENGEGTPVDNAKAAYWFMQSAAQEE